MQPTLARGGTIMKRTALPEWLRAPVWCVFVMVGVALVFLTTTCQVRIPTGVGAAPTGMAQVTRAPTRPANSISISIVTNNTKAEWLNAVTDEFNAGQVKTTAGHQIVVEIVPEDSPEPTVRKIVAGELKPTLW